MKGSLHLVSLRGQLMGGHTSKKFQMDTWRRFLGGEIINHSQMGKTLPDIVNRCEKEGIYYELRAFPGMGYTIKRILNVPTHN